MIKIPQGELNSNFGTFRANTLTVDLDNLLAIILILSLPNQIRNTHLFDFIGIVDEE